MKNLLVITLLSLFPSKSGNSNGNYTETPNLVKYHTLQQEFKSIQTQKKVSLDLLQYQVNKTNLQ